MIKAVKEQVICVDDPVIYPTTIGIEHDGRWFDYIPDEPEAHEKCYNGKFIGSIRYQVQRIQHLALVDFDGF